MASRAASRAARAATGLRAALHAERLISWMLILKWIPARTPQGTKAECVTAPATVPPRISRAANILTTNANNSWKTSKMQVQNLPLEVFLERASCSLWAGVGSSPAAGRCRVYRTIYFCLVSMLHSSNGHRASCRAARRRYGEKEINEMREGAVCAALSAGQEPHPSSANKTL